MTQRSPKLCAATLSTLRNADPWTQSLSSAMTGFVTHLTTEEAASLPETIAGVLPQLRQHIERLRFAAEIAVRLDLFEQAVELRDRRLLLDAASLCGNPAAGSEIRAAVSKKIGDAPAGRIRLDRCSNCCVLLDTGLGTPSRG